MPILTNIAQSVQLIFRRPQRQQFAALCYRFRKGSAEPEILVLTSRDTGRWVIPKGWPMGPKPGYEVALQEAGEEAGVTGDVLETALGTYCYDKGIQDGFTVPCRVTVFPLRVTGQLEKYKEKGKRKLEWVTPDEAASRVAEPQLKDIIRTFAKSSGSVVR